MRIFPEKYYHIYNRSNNREIVYRNPENYHFFLTKYRKYFEQYAEVIAYCLMPTHFHFLLYIKSVLPDKDSAELNRDPILDTMNKAKYQFGILLSSYSKAMNKQRNRHGSLFQRHTKTIEVDDESYLLTLIGYIHQNPVRAKLVRQQEEWEFSSYRDYIGIRNGTLPNKDILYSYFRSEEEYREYSKDLIESVREKYWV